MARSTDIPDIIKWLVIAGVVSYSIYWVQNRQGASLFSPAMPSVQIPGPLDPSSYTLNTPTFSF